MDSDEQIARFVETTGCDTDQATFLLEATHGNFESAVQMYYGKDMLQHQKASTYSCSSTGLAVQFGTHMA